MGHHFNPIINQQNLYMCVDAGNARSYAGTGNTAFNLRGTDTIGLVNGVTYSSSNSGYFIFNGTNQNLTLTLPALTNYTFSFWLYVISYDNTERQILGTNGDVVGLSLISNKFNIWNGSTNLGNTVFSTGQWYNVVYTRTGSSTIIYLNGASDGSFATGANVTAGAATIGSISGLRYLNARIALFNFYDRTLSAAEVLKNYNSIKKRFGL